MQIPYRVDDNKLNVNFEELGRQILDLQEGRLVWNCFQSSGMDTNFSTSTTESWIYTGYAVSFTAPCAGVVCLSAFMEASHNAANANVDSILQQQTSENVFVANLKADVNGDMGLANRLHGFNYSVICPISAGSWKFTLLVLNHTAGTLTVKRTDVVRTRIEGIFLGTKVREKT